MSSNAESSTASSSPTIDNGRSTKVRPLSCPSQSIASLVPGPGSVRFAGVVVNIISSYNISSSTPEAAKGCIKLLVRDRSGEILVKLWHTELSYSHLILGSRVDVATNHVFSAASHHHLSEAPKELPANLMVNIFPEKDSGCAIDVHQDWAGQRKGGHDPDSPTEAGHNEVLGDEYAYCGQAGTQELGITSDGLVNLESFVHGATLDKTPGEVKLLVAVIEVGKVREVITRDQRTFHVFALTVIDQSCLSVLPQHPTPERMDPANASTWHRNFLQSKSSGHGRSIIQTCELSLSTSLYSSCQNFSIPTILLLTSPKLISRTRRRIRLTSSSQTLVNPTHLSDALGLYKWTRRLLVHRSFPRDTTDKSFQVNESQHNYRQTEPHQPTGMKRLSLGLNTYDLRSSTSNSHQPSPSAKTQYTISLFLVRIQLRPSIPFRAYISVIVTQVHLLSLWDVGRVFVTACQRNPCHGEAYGRSPKHMQCCDCGEHIVEIPGYDLTSSVHFNSQILGGIADEEAGYQIDTIEKPSIFPATESDWDAKTDASNLSHNLFLTDRAVHGLTGLRKSDFEGDLVSFTTHHQFAQPQDTGSHSDEQLRAKLQDIEDFLRWTRLTLVLGWTGDSEDDLEEGTIVVLEAIN